MQLRRRYWTLMIRKGVILACAAVAAVDQGIADAAVVALLLTALAVLGSLTSVGPHWWQPAAECLGAALVVTSLAPAGWAFVPYLLVPVVQAGLHHGTRLALVAFAVSAAVMVAMELVPVLPAPGEPTALAPPVLWLPVLGLAALVSGWAQRRTGDEEPVVEHAYTDAHRLLSELNMVARQLSLGLDPHTLATALVEELQGIASGARATVLIRSAAGRFVPVVGDAPNPLAESAVLDAWVAADLVRRGRSGRTVVALPVLMGERVVAVVVLADSTGSHSLGDDSVRTCRTVVAEAGPRLASALLFDDVRRLATVDERHRLAREIHDGIAQDMASVGYQIDDIANDAPTEVSQRLHDLREYLTTLVSELRLSIFDLRAGVDESVGLSRTLSDYVQRVGKQAGLVVHTSADESPHRLPLATEVELLRIVQEAVTNVRRHAYADNLWLTVVVDPPNAHIVVADDGRGLGRPRPDSMGITGMTERAKRIGARLTVSDRTDDSGTVVEVVMPGGGRPRDVRRHSARATHGNHSVTDARQGVVVADSPSRDANTGAAWEGTS